MSATANLSDGELTCLIDRLEESFDLHVTWSSINHLSPDLENTKLFLSVANMLEKHVMWTFAAPYSAHWQADCPQADSAVHWPDSDFEHEPMSRHRKCLKTFQFHLALSTHLLFIAVLHLCIQKVQRHRLREVHKLRGGEKRYWTDISES